MCSNIAIWMLIWLSQPLPSADHSRPSLTLIKSSIPFYADLLRLFPSVLIDCFRVYQVGEDRCAWPSNSWLVQSLPWAKVWGKGRDDNLSNLVPFFNLIQEIIRSSALLNSLGSWSEIKEEDRKGKEKCGFVGDGFRHERSGLHAANYSLPLLISSLSSNVNQYYFEWGIEPLTFVRF